MKKNNDKSLKKIFDELDIKPKKHLGQNFLHDLNIIKAVSYTHLRAHET